MMHISRERTIFVCYQFFKELRKRFGRKPIFADGARWYKDACKWLRLKQQVYATEFIQKIKDRSECFDDHFPCRSESCNRQHIINWIKMFTLYLHMKTDRIKLMKFPTQNS
jgi:putative transposase